MASSIFIPDMVDETPNGIFASQPNRAVLPVIVATSSSDGQAESKALELGAWDFVTKPYDGQIIRFRLKNAIDAAVDHHDMVIVNAGSSAGTEDYTVHILRELGEVVIHGVAVKPGKPVILGIIKSVVDKNVKNDSTGEYEPSGETREENTIEKVFHHPSKVTVVEAREAQKAGRDAEATFYDKWVEKNKGVTRNKAKGASGNGGNSGRPGGGAPQAGGGQQKKTNSLFGGK